MVQLRKLRNTFQIRIDMIRIRGLMGRLRLRSRFNSICIRRCTFIVSETPSSERRNIHASSMNQVDWKLRCFTGRLETAEVVVEESRGRDDAAAGEERRLGGATHLLAGDRLAGGGAGRSVAAGAGGGGTGAARGALVVRERQRLLEARPVFVHLQKIQGIIKRNCI